MRKSAVIFLLGALGLGSGCGDPSPEPDAGDGDLPDGDAPDGDAPDADSPDADSPDADSPDADSPDGQGHITFHRDGRVYRIAAEGGAQPEDVSAALDPFALGAGADGVGNLSADGQWLILSSERFHAECQGWPCLVLVPADLSSAAPILAAGAPVHPEGFYAVAAGGDLVVYVGAEGPNDRDLYAVRRAGSGWSAPETLTAESSQAFHDLPSLSPDGARVIFDCGPLSFGQSGLCEVGTDGSGFREVLMPAHVPAGMPGPARALTHPAYLPGGAIVFEGDWDGERLWRLAGGATEPEGIDQAVTNDNSPCALPDGRVASLWLNRPENSEGVHELKLLSAEGGAYQMLVTGLEIDDWGLGCGR